MLVRKGAARTIVLAAVLSLISGSSALAQGQGAGSRLDALQQLNGSVEALVTRVSRSVVQVLVTAYEPVGGRNDTDLVIGRQRSLGSGVVIDTEGYILTNAHVVSNARRVQVVLPATRTDDSAGQSSTEAGGGLMRRSSVLHGKSISHSSKSRARFRRCRWPTTTHCVRVRSCSRSAARKGSATP